MYLVHLGIHTALEYLSVPYVSVCMLRLNGICASCGRAGGRACVYACVHIFCCGLAYGWCWRWAEWDSSLKGGVWVATGRCVFVGGVFVSIAFPFPESGRGGERMKFSQKLLTPIPLTFPRGGGENEGECSQKLPMPVLRSINNIKTSPHAEQAATAAGDLPEEPRQAHLGAGRQRGRVSRAAGGGVGGGPHRARQRARAVLALLAAHGRGYAPHSSRVHTYTYLHG